MPWVVLTYLSMALAAVAAIRKTLLVLWRPYPWGQRPLDPLEAASLLPSYAMFSVTGIADEGEGASTSIIKPQKDERDFEAIVLPNKMQVMLISDPEAEKAAVALDVLVGHFSDPESVPGLAHFCEHMLFLGTKTYPKEGQYKESLTRWGGRSNAYTSQEHTNYKFDVVADHLEAAMDRFADFFKTPLFTESATERVMNAVDSENKMKLQACFLPLFLGLTSVCLPPTTTPLPIMAVMSCTLMDEHGARWGLRPTGWRKG